MRNQNSSVRIIAGNIRQAHTIGLASALLLGSSLISPAHAIEFSHGEFEGSFDTTLTAGTIFRVSDQDPKNIGFANGGTRYSINGDDGNLNYDQGLASAALRATHELSVDWRNFGAFVRGTYFYDLVNANGDEAGNFKPLTDDTIERIGRDVKLLDAYVYTDFHLGDSPAELRLGNQVLNWGESTFIQNGINAINPIDVSAIRIPGSELRQALTPLPMISTNIGLSQSISLEAFYQFYWDSTEPEAVGSLFSTNDFATPGAEYVFLGFGAGGSDPRRPNADGSFGIPDMPETVIQYPTGFFGEASVGTVAPRLQDREPDDSGQFGVALRWYSELLNETEFGFYYLHYHSRLPVSSGRGGTLTGLAGITDPNYAASAGYFNEYPEDIDLFGVSFNTLLPSGTSLQGEVSLKKDQPLQIDDVEMLQAVVAPGAIRAAAIQGAQGGAAAVQATPGFDSLPAATQQALVEQGAAAGELQAVTQAGSLFAANQVIQRMGGIVVDPSSAANTLASSDRLFGAEFQGYERFDVWQAQMTATHAFGPIEKFGVNQWVLLGEVGWTYIPDLPDNDVLLFEGANTPLPGTATGSLIGNVPQQDGGFATKSSWGYRVALRFDMLNAIGPVSLFPTISFSHDVQGTTPSPIANFIEDRAAVSLGLGASYMQNWSGKIQYTNFFAIGDNEHNLLNDRDFVSISVSYSF